MVDRVAAPWLAEVRRAALASLASPAFGAWVRYHRRGGDAVEVLQALSDDLGEGLPYRFDGPAHRIASWQDCRARGWGACADAAAHLAAAAVVLRMASVSGPPMLWFAFEAPSVLPDYSHLRTVIRRTSGRRVVDVVLDPFGLRAAPMRPRADYVVPVDDVLRLGGAANLQPGAASLAAWVAA